MTPIPPLGSRDSAVGLFGLGIAEHPASEDPLGLLHNEGISNTAFNVGCKSSRIAI